MQLGKCLGQITSRTVGVNHSNRAKKLKVEVVLKLFLSVT